MKMQFVIKPAYQNAQQPTFNMAIRRPQTSMALVFTNKSNSRGCGSCGG